MDRHNHYWRTSRLALMWLCALEGRGVAVRLDPEASGWMDGSRATASWLLAGVTVILAGASLIVAHKRNTRTRGWLAG